MHNTRTQELPGLMEAALIRDRAAELLALCDNSPDGGATATASSLKL